jgi:Na+/proline symporter
LLSSGALILFQFGLFLLLGVMLYVFYMLPSAHFGKPDLIYPTFIVTQMPHGISGLLIAAILAAAMSNLSAALNSLSSSTILDFVVRLRPQIDSPAGDRSRMMLSRLATVFWAIVLFSLAILSLHRAGRVVEVGLQIASISYGALLGVFLLGVLTRRANQTGAAIGMVCGFAIEVYLWKFTPVPWTWWVAIGTATTFSVGYILSWNKTEAAHD